MLPKVRTRLKIPKSYDHVFITLSLPMKFKSKSKLNHMLKNDITTIMDLVLFFHTPKLESYIVPDVCTKLKNKIKSIGILECKCGHIIPPYLNAKTHVLEKRVILQPNTN